MRHSAWISILIAVLAPTAQAQQAQLPEGYLTAFACEPITRPLQVNSQVMDNTAENVRLHRLLLKSLARSGVLVRRDAAHSLSLDIQLVREAARRKPGDLVDVRVGETEEIQGREGFAKFHMNIWSNARDSVIGGRRNTIEGQMVDRLSISVTINSRRDGRCLWRGEAVQNLDGRNANRAGDQMIPILVNAIGTSASQKPIDID